MVAWKGDTPIRLTSGGESVSNGQTSSATTTAQPSITTHTQQLNDCVEVPRPQSTANDADALVFFGATGDLAYKKIFPAIQTDDQKGPPECSDHWRREGRMDIGSVAGASS